jgi:threonine dehydrogenase-like Zn-dependent dehydrogenase
MANMDLSPLVVNEIKVIGSRCGPFPEAINALANGSIDVLSLISRRFKLADGVDALNRAQNDRELIKVMIEP